MNPMNERPDRYVLCLDDDQDFLKSLEMFLPDQINSDEDARGTYHFLFLDEPMQALETLSDLIAEGSTVAMIISDQQMPSIKGTEFLTRARKIAPDSVRILLTGHAGIEAAIGAINERLLDRYLTKPIEDQHGFALNVRQLLQRFEMSRVIEAQSANLQSLYEFANRINGMTDLPSMLDCVAKYSLSLLGCSAVHVETIDHGEPSGSVARGSNGHSGSSRAGMPSTASVGCADTRQDLPDDLRPSAARAGIAPDTQVAYARLRAGETNFGVVLASHASRKTFSAHDFKTLGYVVDTASTAIEKQRTWTRLAEAHRVTTEQAHSLEIANQKLALLDKMKREFLTFISHELRTPLGHMSAISMLDESLASEDQLELTAIVRKGYDRLNKFIVLGLEYLDWCGMGRVESRETTDLRLVVIAGLAELRKSHDSEVQCDLAFPDQPCWVQMPRAHVQDVVSVLLANALKFAAGVPHLRVAITGQSDGLTLHVVDRGRGFPPEMSARIFEPFTLTDNRHHHEGTALNLARIRAMIEAYGGEASAQSAGPGLGATFSIRFAKPVANGCETRVDPACEVVEEPPAPLPALAVARAFKR